jgi:hypothetical protein
MTENPNRHPKGTPTGGQFAASAHAEADVDLDATGAAETPTGTCPSCFAERPHPLAAGKMAYLPGSVCPNCGHIETDMEVESDDGDWLVTLDDQGTIRAVDEHGNTEDVLDVDDPEWDRYADLLDVDRDRVKAALEHAYAEAGAALADDLDTDTGGLVLADLDPARVDRLAKALGRSVHRHHRAYPPGSGDYDDFDGGYERGRGQADAELLTVLTHPALGEDDVPARRDIVIDTARATQGRDDYLAGLTGSTGMTGQDRARWTEHCLVRAIAAYDEQRGAAEFGADRYTIGSAAGRRYGYANAAAVLYTGDVNNASEVSQQIEDGVAAGCTTPDQVRDYLYFRSVSPKETVDAYGWGDEF